MPAQSTSRNRAGQTRESEDRLTERGSEEAFKLEVDHGGGESRKNVGDRTEDEEVAVVLGVLRLVLGVEEEEGIVAVLLHPSAWSRGVHGVGATELA